VPSLLSQEDRSYYTQLFAAIERQDWTNVQTMLAQRSDGPLHAVARAQFYLAATSPKVDLASLTDLMSRAPDLPWTDQLGRLALKRGATTLPITPSAQSFAVLPTTPRRTRPRSTADGTMPDSVAQAIQDRIKADDPLGARVLLDGIDASLSSDARAEWRQKVGWSFYIENDDANARLVALSATQGGSGPWVAEALWTAGLAAWRMDDCMAAADAFQRAATQGTNPEG